MTTYTSHYPSPADSTTVKSTSYYSASYREYFAFDIGKSLSGVDTNNQWYSNASSATNQKLNVDLGSPLVITRLYIENSHSSGSYTIYGAKNFEVFGTNSSTAFNNTTYSDSTDLTSLGSFQLARHSAVDGSDPQYFTLTNSTAYQYIVIKFADCWGSPFFGVRRVGCQTTDSSSSPGNATPVGLSATSSLGSCTGTGKGTIATTGRSVTSYLGTAVASVYGSAQALPEGVSVTSSKGISVAKGRASANVSETGMLASLGTSGATGRASIVVSTQVITSYLGASVGSVAGSGEVSPQGSSVTGYEGTTTGKGKANIQVIGTGCVASVFATSHATADVAEVIISDFALHTAGITDVAVWKLSIGDMQ